MFAMNSTHILTNTYAGMTQLEDKTKAVAKKLLKAKKLKQKADELVNSSHKLGNVTPNLFRTCLHTSIWLKPVLLLHVLPWQQQQQQSHIKSTRSNIPVSSRTTCKHTHTPNQLTQIIYLFLHTLHDNNNSNINA